MNYWQFRLRLYQHTLREWLNSLSQLSAAIVTLFPMAMYALLLLPLLAMGVLADKDSAGENYVYTLWGYLLLSYCWIGMQREALLASDNHFYDTSLPISRRKRQLTNSALLLYAANVFIAAPFIVLCVMLVSHVDKIVTLPIVTSVAHLFPVTGLLLLTYYYCISALGEQRPWVSLFVLPVIAMPWAHDVNQWQCILGVVLAIMAERAIALPRIAVTGLPAGVWQLFLQHDIARPKPTVLRMVAVLLVLITGSVFVRNIGESAQGAAAALFAIVLGVISGSKLIELQSLRAQFHRYLASLPLSQSRISMVALGYCLVFSTPLWLLTAMFGLFSMPDWGMYWLLYVATQCGILLQPRYYLLFPLLTAIAVLMISLLL